MICSWRYDGLSVKDKKDKSEHDERGEHEEHDGVDGSGQRYICLNCIDKAEELDERYHMFVRCPAKVQDDKDKPMESIIIGLQDRLSQVEASQNRLEGKLETLLDRFEGVLQRANTSYP